jgi:serine/threonine protein kinase
MTRYELMEEARLRQGTTLVASNRRTYRISGTSRQVAYRPGGEGLVQFAVDTTAGVECCIKCFWDPNAARRKRSELLVQQRLANRNKLIADALAGAPYEIIERVGRHTPFAILMKKVSGESWADLKERVKAGSYPPTGWPDIKVRATWAYGLATAIQTLEKNHFIHADLSEGNVMLTVAEPHAGDMALVDFDAFVHPAHPQLDLQIKGSPGYAAPEVWNQQSVGIGSDRLGMALLIQEFLLVGDPAVPRDDILGWVYDQEAELCRRAGEPHPYVTKKHPKVAKLIRDTIKAVEPLDRPSPDDWRELLREIATGRPARKKMTDVILSAVPPASAHQVVFGDASTSLDLARTTFHIRATIERNRDGSVDVVVPSGAQVNAQSIDVAKIWKSFPGPARIPLRPGVVMFDPQGRCRVKVDGKEA